jgi:hypothetical protein
MNAQQMVERGRNHTSLRTELDRQGLLFAHERELILDAADALLFDEPEAEERRREAMDLLDALEINGRRTDAEAARLRDALDGCGDHNLVPA